MSQKTARTTRSKGNIVEQVAAKMHEGHGVDVQTQVRLPPALVPFGKQITERTKREIDVLITVSYEGHTVQFAIECKNEGQRVGAEHIDAFVGKLHYVGIPTKHGIYVATNQYTKGAKERAENAGIELLTLEGLTSDKLENIVFGAVQSVVHLLLEVIEMNQTTGLGWSGVAGIEITHIDGDGFSPGFTPGLYYDKDKNYLGNPFDLVWRMWRDGELPTTPGEHQVEIKIPQGWFEFVALNGVPVPDPVSKLEARYRVIAHVLTIKGKATRHFLFNAADATLKKGKIDAKFPSVGFTERGTFITEDTSLARVQVAMSKEELRRCIADAEESNIISLIRQERVPRIRAFGRFGTMFWPPSEGSLEKLRALVEEYGEGYEPDLEKTGQHHLGDEHLGKAWEPIHPLYKST